ncbi:cyclic nucleotide-binding protein [Mucilaginibacter sp. PPCGB 2223]|uniref:Crp/Fnr family transcriptional regulator n=1 Tax=Mucilaginibacter sp. PPCGB 2223 TaxID=1886027 RepID=UPI0008246761|nr:Crp/Fnr family transcriptional regulator [Mucilaginibacter sp. PPCGB 2223]OCX54064.1 cyclic nucleotide-binding protein [Mucilaginibacter sp. PPCGB 2223]
MYTQLSEHIRRFVTLTVDEEQLLQAKIQSKTLKKKEFLLQPGKVCPGNYFVVKGCLRLYFVNDKLNEQITQFAIESWWIADYDSLLNKQPSQCYIQAIEPCELFFLPAMHQTELFEQVPKLQTYFYIMMQKAFVASQRRIGFIFNQSDEERYRHFVKLFPGFIQRVPQYMLASYLGFTPQFLSRLRAKKD